MANQVNASGPVLFKVAFGYNASLETLGYSLDQPRVVDQPFWYDVHGDQHGGMNGPPIDIQYLGQITRIRAELSRFDRDVANKIRTRVPAGTATPGYVRAADIGALALQGNQYIRVSMQSQGVTGSAGEPRNYPLCIPREAVEQSYGVKFSTLIVEFESHRDQSSGALSNTTTS